MLHGGEWLVKKYASLAQPRGNQTLDTTLFTLASRLQDVGSQSQDGQPGPPLPPLQDRKAAVLALKGLARDHPVEVGDKALSAILESMCRDAVEDDEIARAVVEACLTLCEPAHSGPSTGQGASGAGNMAGKDLTGKVPAYVVKHVEQFLDTPKPLHALLPLLAPTRSFYTRFSSLQLLTLLLRIRMERVQEHVLTSPGGCGAILECLVEGSGTSAEIVRNEALLLLPLLVSANADIQKLVAFEGAFEKLIDVVAVEGRIEGGVVVQDALEALVALLRYNVSNQNYFRETLSVPLLAPLLFYPPPPSPNQQAQEEHASQLEAFAFQQWNSPAQDTLPDGQESASRSAELDEQKVVNASLVLRVAQLLVEGQGDGKKLNQNALLSCGFTKCLFELALASTAPLSLKSQALNVLTALLRSNRSSQDLLSDLLVCPLLSLDTAGGADGNYTRLPARPAILELIGLTVNGPAQGTASTASLAIRASALNCFDAFVNDNLDARLGIINTMVPSPSDGEEDGGASVSAGKLLLEGVAQLPGTLSQGSRLDPYKTLISALLFAHLIRGSETAKDLARRLLFGGSGNVVGQADASKAKGGNDEDDEQSTLIQVLVGNFTMALREHGEATRRERGAGAASKSQVHGRQGSPADWTRVQVGYLIVLSTWFWESRASVEEFLRESSNLQVLIQPVSQGGNMIDPVVSGLCAVVLGIVYEYGPVGEANSEDEGVVTRAAMHPILHSRIGPDQFAARLNQLRDDARFKSTEPDTMENIGGQGPPSTRGRETGVGLGGPSLIDAADEQGGIWFDWNFVDFVKSNHVLIQKAILVDPQSTSATQANQSTELLDAKRQFEQMKENYAKSHREIDLLQKKLKEMEEATKEERQSILTKLEHAEGESEALRDEVKRLSEAGEGAQKERAQVETLETRLKQLQLAHDDKDARVAEAGAAQAKTVEESNALKKKLDEVQRRAEEAEKRTAETQKRAEEAERRAEEAQKKAELASANGVAKASTDDDEGEKTKEEVEKELEDLLILLDELSTKRKADKKRMREKGMDVSEDEGEDEDENDDVD